MLEGEEDLLMLNLSQPVTCQDLGKLGAPDFLRMLRAYCSSGGQMHPNSLKAVVIKLTYLSRDMAIKQTERDEAASMATSLANAAIKSYGRQSAFCSELVAEVQMVLGRGAA